MGARCLVKVKKGKAVLRMANPTDKNVFWKNNTILATVSEIDAQHVFCLNDTNNTQNSEQVNHTETSTNHTEHSEEEISFNFDDSALSAE